MGDFLDTLGDSIDTRLRLLILEMDMISGASDKLRQWLEMGCLSVEQYQAAINLVGERPSASSWWAFFQLTTFVLSTGALVFALLFFIAFNWADMSHMVKFALLESALVLAVLGYFYRVKIKQDEGVIVGWCLVGISLLIGGLLALFGQVYQTGADSWQLFFSWTLLVTPIALVSRFLPMWCMWLLLVNVTALLFYGQTQNRENDADMWAWFSFHLLLNTLLLIACEWLRDKTFTFNPLTNSKGSYTARRVLVMVCLMVLVFYWMDYSWKDNSAAFVLPFWLMGAMFYYRFRAIDIFVLSVCLVMLALHLTYLAQIHLFDRGQWSIGWFLNALILLVIGGFGTRWLRALAGELDRELDHEVNSNANEVNSNANEDKNNISQHTEQEQPSLWQQLINHELVPVGSCQPKSGLHGVMNITAVFSLLGIGAGIFFIIALFSLFPMFAEKTAFQMIGVTISLVTCWWFSKQVQSRANYYVPTVLMLILAMIFAGLLLIEMQLQELTMLFICTVCSFVAMTFLKLKSLRFMLFVLGCGALLRVVYLFNVEVVFIIVVSFAWLYSVFNEQRLFDRFGVSAVLPISHGMLVMLLLAGVHGQEKYHLFDGNTQIAAEHLAFFMVSICSLIALFTCIYLIAKGLSFKAFKRLLIAGLLLVILLFSVPLVSLSLCIMLSGFYLQRRGWLMIGSLSMLYFIGLFYYDLNATLDAKALYLALFGLGVIALRYCIKFTIANSMLDSTSNKEAQS